LQNGFNPIHQCIRQTELHRHNPNALIVNMSAFYGILFSDQNGLRTDGIQKSCINLTMVWQSNALKGYRVVLEVALYAVKKTLGVANRSNCSDWRIVVLR
jgi:hypothetical protein